MNQKVFVITNPELGWDCVCGVFSTREKALDYLEEIGIDDDLEDGMSFEEFIEKNNFIIHETILN